MGIHRASAYPTAGPDGKLKNMPPLRLNMTEDELPSLEDELNDWLSSIPTSGFIASLSVNE